MAYFMVFILYFFLLIFFMKVYFVGTHLNCLETIQMSTHNIFLYLFIKYIIIHRLKSED